MTISYKTFGNRLYVTNLSTGGILKIQQSGVDVTLIRLEDNTVDLSYLEQGRYYSFSDLNDLTQTHVVFKQLMNGLNQDNIEFLFINQEQTEKYLNNIEAKIATSQINFIFNKIKDVKVIDERYAEFFSSFSSYSDDSEVKSLIRSKIIKQSGDSDFIAKEFGIENFFTLNEFEERIADRIRNTIDLNLNGVYKFEDTRGSLEGGASNSPENSRNLLRLTPNGRGRKVINFSNFEDIDIGENKWHTEAFKKLDERAGTTTSNNFGTDSIPYQDLKDSQLYQNPVRYDFIAPYDIKGEKRDIYPYSRLGNYYNPSSERILWDRFTKWLNGPSSSNTTGIDEIILGYYIGFVYELEEEIRDSELSKSIGEHFDRIVDFAFPYIMNWMIVHYENLVRYNLAKLVAEKPVDKLETIKPEDALDIAETAADLNLQGMQGDLGEEELTEEDIQQRIQLYKQCALLLNSEDLKNEFDSSNLLKSNNNDSMHQNYYYNNRFYMVESSDDNLTIKNKLISPSGSKIKPFMEITPDIISALKPRLRLYKVYTDRSNKTISFEFPFPSYIDSDRVRTFDGKEIDRGDGVGIKSFNFSFDGETPATSQQYISADLSLYFQTFSDFVKLRKAPKSNSEGEDEEFRYADLFVNTKYCPPDLSSTSPLNYDPSFYRLRVDVGWEPRIDDGFKQIIENRGLNLEEFNEALSVMNKSFYLNLVDHEINISDSGTVTVSANYIAYIEGLMDSNNVLLSAEAKQLQDQFVNKYEELVKSKNCDPNELAEVRASINALRVSSRNVLHQSLIEKLVKNRCMYYVHVESKDRKDFARTKFFSRKPKLKTNSLVRAEAKISEGAITGDVLSKAEDIVNTKNTTKENYDLIMNTFVTDPNQNSMERVSFFYMADLVYFLLDPLYVDGEPEEQIKIILSSFSLNVPFTPNDVSLNIGQIPIEIEVFTKWYKDEIIDKELDSISFLEFIKRLTFYLITDIFSEICIDQQQHKRLSFMNATINSVKNKTIGTMEEILSYENEQVIDINEYYSDGTLPLKTSAFNQERLKPTDFVQYLLIYPHHRPETHVGRARALDDARRGVHHLYIGADRGILKNASFSKTDIQYLRESRMLTQGENGLLQLSSLYRANLKMIGNTIFYPGMLLYLNPFGFGGMDFGLPHQGPGTVEEPNLSNIMGIGGYQKVVKVSSTISDSGKFETDVECIFEHTGEPPRDETDKNQRSPGQRSGKGQQDIRRITCKDLNKADASDTSCPASTVAKDLQNQLLKINRQGTIDLPETENDQ